MYEERLKNVTWLLRMLEPTRTKFYKYTDLGAPVFKGQYLDLTTMFDALLVNGFNTKTPSSFSLADNILTITFATAHGYTNYAVLKITNANVPMYNREFRVRNVTEFTLSILVDNTFTALPTNPIEILISNAPLGFTKKFEGTGKRVYTNPNWDVAMKMDDYQHADWNANWTRFARIQFATDYSDVDTGLGYIYPNIDLTSIRTYSGQTYKYWCNTKLCISRSINSSEESTGHVGTNTRAWYLIGDDKGFYFIQSIHNGYATDRGYYHHNYIGTFKSFSPDIGPFTNNDVLWLGYYNGNVSNTSKSETQVNDTYRDDTSQGTYSGFIFSPITAKTWFRLRPFLNAGQVHSGNPTNTTNRANNYEYLLKDILGPIFVEQVTTVSSTLTPNMVGEVRGMKSILTDLMSTVVTRTEKNSDFTIMTREDNTSLMYITNNRTGLTAIDIIQDWD